MTFNTTTKTYHKDNSATFATISYGSAYVKPYIVAILQGTPNNQNDQTTLAMGYYKTQAGAIKFIEKQFAI